MIDILRAQISAEESKPQGERNEERLSALKGQLEVHMQASLETFEGTDKNVLAEENNKFVGEDFPAEVKVEVEPSSYDSILD